MKENNLEVVKNILMTQINEKLSRSKGIDQELKDLSEMNYFDIDQKIIMLERKINRSQSLLEKIQKRLEIKESKIKLENLKIEKTLLMRIHTDRINSLLEEKHSLAYNEYNYVRRLMEIANAKTWEELSLTEEETEILSKYQEGILPQEEFGSQNSYKLEHSLPVIKQTR